MVYVGIILTRKGLLETICPAIACPKGVTTGLAWAKGGNPPPETYIHCHLGDVIDYQRKKTNHSKKSKMSSLMFNTDSKLTF